jgi:hypothetical protein
VYFSCSRRHVSRDKIRAGRDGHRLLPTWYLAHVHMPRARVSNTEEGRRIAQGWWATAEGPVPEVIWAIFAAETCVAIAQSCGMANEKRIVGSALGLPSCCRLLRTRRSLVVIGHRLTLSTRPAVCSFGLNGCLLSDACKWLKCATKKLAFGDALSLVANAPVAVLHPKPASSYKRM